MTSARFDHHMALLEACTSCMRGDRGDIVYMFQWLAAIQGLLLELQGQRAVRWTSAAEGRN